MHHFPYWFARVTHHSVMSFINPHRALKWLKTEYSKQGKEKFFFSLVESRYLVLIAFKLRSATHESNKNLLASQPPSSGPDFSQFSPKCEQKQSNELLQDKA